MTLLVGSASAAWATCPNSQPHNGTRCTETANVLTCDAANWCGGSGCVAGVTVYAVHDSASVCAGDYCVWGTDDDGTECCYEWTLSGGETGLRVLGTEYGDTINFQNSGAQNLDTYGAYAFIGTGVGREGDDTINGSRSANTYYQDFFHGDEGVDTIFGEEGNDTIYGEGDGDFLYGDAGVDTIHGTGGVDFIDGDSEGDFLYGGSEGDEIYGGSGIDDIDAGPGDDYVDAGGGNDNVQGYSGADVLVGGPGDDTLICGDHNDIVCGMDHNDTMFGNGGDDTLWDFLLVDGDYMDGGAHASGGDWCQQDTTITTRLLCEYVLVDGPDECGQ